MNAIEIRNISKSYGSVTALDDISLSVGRGELFGLIGPDGAGKTTMFRILATLIDPDQGNATVAGLDIGDSYRSIRSRIGYMPGRFSLYPDLSVRENLNFFASLFNVTVADNHSLIAPIYSQIEPFASRKAGKLSGGMKQKLALCCALIHKPEVLFLDEPTTGVDAVSRQEFWDMLDTLKASGITVMVSTPYMDEAVRCDRAALISRGRIMATDTPGRLAAAACPTRDARCGRLLYFRRHAPSGGHRGIQCGQSHGDPASARSARRPDQPGQRQYRRYVYQTNEKWITPQTR